MPHKRILCPWQGHLVQTQDPHPLAVGTLQASCREGLSQEGQSVRWPCSMRGQFLGLFSHAASSDPLSTTDEGEQSPHKAECMMGAFQSRATCTAGGGCGADTHALGWPTSQGDPHPRPGPISTWPWPVISLVELLPFCRLLDTVAFITAVN